jgi:hydroxypyruvate isomerase
LYDIQCNPPIPRATWTIAGEAIGVDGQALAGTRDSLEVVSAERALQITSLLATIANALSAIGYQSYQMRQNLAQIAHLQLADNPGRNEPGTGEINYGFLFVFLDKIGYQGWIGCEYKPAATTEAGLGWAHAYLKQ